MIMTINDKKFLFIVLHLLVKKKKVFPHSWDDQFFVGWNLKESFHKKSWMPANDIALGSFTFLHFVWWTQMCFMFNSDSRKCLRKRKCWKSFKKVIKNLSGLRESLIFWSLDIFFDHFVLEKRYKQDTLVDVIHVVNEHI